MSKKKLSGQSNTHRLQEAVLRIIPLMIVLLLLPFLLAFDSLMYWMTRPTCLGCGSLTGFLQTSSLSVFMVSAMIGEINLMGYSFGKKNHE